MKNFSANIIISVISFAAVSLPVHGAPLVIESFLTPPAAGGPAVVALRGAGVADLADGDVLHSARVVLGQVGNPVKFQTGRLKVNKIENGRALATILSDGTAGSAGVFGRFNKVMAGDSLTPAAFNFRQNLAMTPTISLEFHDLFADPDVLPDTLELTDAGRTKLSAAVAGLHSVRTRMIAVEGYVDPSGDSVTNQVESYERAMTVRRFLVNNLGFDPERITAFGLGEQEPVDQSNLAGSAVHNRRIVIKVIPLSEG